MSTSTKSFPHNGKPASASIAVAIDPSAIEKTSSGVIHFDATSNRRQRMKEQSAAKSNFETSEKAIKSDIATEPKAQHVTPLNAVTPTPMTPPKPTAVATNVPVDATPWWQRVMREFPADGLANTSKGVPSDTAVENSKTQPQAVQQPKENADVGHSIASLKQFLVNFVVEQTGYPEDIVELNADLEADLGIDSIKKAQMFGEIGEYFGLQPDESLSLDDFTTLATVLDYLSEQVGATKVEDSTHLHLVKPKLNEADTVQNTSLTLSVESHATHKSSSLNKVTESTTSNNAELRAFLVNFVVEQTGYPEDIVEMDADLEADLGIDSIKKAQMFGEIGEYFGLEPDENLSLDDFTTLAKVLRYLEDNVRR